MISDVVKPRPPEALLAWMSSQSKADLCISVLTVAEIRRGVLEAPPGKRRRELETWFAGPDGQQALFHGRVLPFDEAAAMIWARLMARGNTSGRPRSALDTMIAAIAQANGCVVVTSNVKDFEGVQTLNPAQRGSQPARASRRDNPND